MAKPRLFHRNRPDPEGLGDREEEKGGAETGMGRGGEGGEGKERATHNTPQPVEEASRVERAIRSETARKRRIRIQRGHKRGRTRMERPQGWPQLRSLACGGTPPPPEENADLLGFTPERAHLLLQGVYGDFLHHNNGSHLDGGIADNAAWQRCWRRLAAQSASWYAMPSGAVGRRFMSILARNGGGFSTCSRQ